MPKGIALSMNNCPRDFAEGFQQAFCCGLTGPRDTQCELRLLVRVLQDATEASFLILGLQAPSQPEKEA